MATEAQLAGLAKARETRKANAAARKTETPKTDGEGLLVENDLGGEKCEKQDISESKVQRRKHDINQMCAWQEFFASAVVSCGVRHETQLKVAVSLADAMLVEYTKKRDEVK